MDHRKKIPLGLSSYKEVRTDGYYYVDKTQYIEVLESLNTKYPILLRPRRFGKTLFADTLKCYYDIKEKDNFEELFGGTYIGQHKTKLANGYYVLHLNFSGLRSESIGALEESFDEYIKAVIQKFINYYEFVELNLNEEIDFVSYTSNFLEALSLLTTNKLFIIVDEYDHFANALLDSPEDFIAVTGRDGFVRSFYEVLKKHTTDIIDRIFITGVTSLTLDSLTSGFNICKNVSTIEPLNSALGFTSDEVDQLLDYLDIPDQENTLKILKENYNGYLFSPSAATKVYNSNMILYYMDEYTIRNGAPLMMTDPNITSDYSKLSSMFHLYQENAEKEAVLQQMMNHEPVAGHLVTSFSLSTQFSYDHFVSLLYYLGLLTIDSGLADGSYLFRVPNQVIRDIYYNYYLEYLTKTYDITPTMIGDALRSLEESSDVSPLVALVEKILHESTEHNNRYLIHFRENTLQTLFYLLLRKSNRYRAKMECKMGQSYIDILHTPAQGGPAIALELKYLSPSKYDAEPGLLEERIKAVHEQVEANVDLLANSGAASIGIVFVGKECRHRELLRIVQ